MSTMITGALYDISPPMQIEIEGENTTMLLFQATCVGPHPTRKEAFIMQGSPRPNGFVPSFVFVQKDEDGKTEPRIQLTPSAGAQRQADTSQHQLPS